MLSPEAERSSQASSNNKAMAPMAIHSAVSVTWRGYRKRTARHRGDLRHHLIEPRLLAGGVLGWVLRVVRVGNGGEARTSACCLRCDWARTGRRSGGAVITIQTLGQYFLHDLTHHLHGVRG